MASYKTKAEKAKLGFFLLLFTTALTTIDFVANILRSNILGNMDLLAWLYYIPAAVGHASLFALVLFLVLYLPVSFIFRSDKVAISLYVVGAILLQILFVLDNFVFALYRFHLNGFVLELVLGGGTEIFVFDFWVCLKFVLLILVVAILPYLLAVYLGQRMYKKLTKKVIITISVVLLLCVVISHVGHAIAAANKQTSIRKSATALPFFFPLTMNSLLDEVGLLNKDEIDNMTYNVPSSDIQYPINTIQITDSVPMYNIVYIAIDSWNPRTCDSINTPNIWKLAKNGQVFSNHYSSSNGTQGSIFGLFFGLSYTYQTEFSIAKMSPVFIDRLIEKGYDIQTFPSALFSSPPFHEIVFRRVPGITIDAKGKDAAERDGYITHSFGEYLSKRNEGGKPFFSFLFYDLPHAISIDEKYQKKFQPSWKEADYMKLNNDIDPTPFFNLYRNCVYYTDSLIGNVLQDIEKKGIMDKTIIVITGDHGQEFNENKKNYWGHNGNYSQWQTHVPFVLYYPGIEPRTYTHMTTHYDVTPTMMSQFLGVKNPPSDYSMGYKLTDTVTRYPHIVGDHVNYGFIFENTIITTNHMGTIEVTDRNVNELPRSAINAKELQEAINLKNRFYK